MKLLTLNTHSLIEKDWETKLITLSDAIIHEEIDLIALQEVNQPKNGERISTNSLFCPKFPLKNGNYMLKLLNIIEKHSQNYTGIWCGFKESYGDLEEGIGIITRFPIEKIKCVELSSGKEKLSWKKRCALGVNTPYGDFYSTHMGWWEDEDEPFLNQWERLKSVPDSKKTWIMGDFNAESHKTNEGYDLIISDGFHDTFTLAEKRDSGYTVCEKIDGWDSRRNRRIDYIFSNFPAKIKYSQTIFNGINYGIVSDHFGVIIETEI